MSNWKEFIGKPNKEFYCASYALAENFRKEECLKIVLTYLNQLPKLYEKENKVFEYIFRTKFKGIEINELAIANVSASRVTLQRILDQNPLIENQIIVEFLTDFVCDLGFWIKKIDENQDFSWLYLNTNNTISEFYYYAIRHELYGESKPNFKNSDARFNISVLLIRHTIEQRIKGILGIDYIDDGNRFIGLSSIFKAINKLKLLKQRKKIDLSKISKINDWANHFLHRGLRPCPWQLEWAENEIGKLFYTGKTTDSKSLSIYASFETESIEKLRNEFEYELMKEKPECSIQWTDSPEIYELEKPSKTNNY